MSVVAHGARYDATTNRSLRYDRNSDVNNTTLRVANYDGSPAIRWISYDDKSVARYDRNSDVNSDT